MARRHDLAVSRVGHSRACPFDLHALVPVPGDILRRGPDDPDVARSGSGRTGARHAELRHVTAESAAGQDRRRRRPRAGTGCQLTFWSADWSPWRALAQIAAALADAALRSAPKLRRTVTDAPDLAPAPNPGLTDQRSDWEDPPRVARTDIAPVLSVDGFAGPLDWFLEMARAKKINLTQLSIGALMEQFADALAAALVGQDPRQLDRWAGWTVMAATLTELWSRLLLPADAAASRAAEAEAEALRRQLLARARMRQAADWLERRSQLGRDVFARGVPEAGVAGRGSDLTDLLRACLVALHVPETQTAAYRPRPPPLWRVSDAIPHLRQRLAALPDGTKLAALLPP